MLINGITQKQIMLQNEYEELNIYFEWNGCKIESIDNKFLNLVIQTKLEEYDSSLESSRYARPKFLTIIGILSFILQENIHTGQAVKSSDFKDIFRDEKLENKTSQKKQYVFKFNGFDYSDDLTIILKKLDEDKEFYSTIFDRLRIASLMFFGENNVGYYNSEAYLAFFNIIELLANKHAKEFRSDLDKKLKELLNDFYSNNFFYSKNAISEKVNTKRKVLKDVIVKEEINIKNQILYLMDKIKIEIPFKENYVGNLIRNRNNVAHGKITYKPAVIWPLPPGFIILDDSIEKCYELYFLTNYIVCSYMKLNFKESFKESLYKDMSYPKELLIEMLEKKKALPTSYQLSNGEENTLNYSSIFKLLVHDLNNKVNEVANLLEEAFLQETATEKNADMILELSILLSDSGNEKVANKAKENVIEIISKSWFGKYSNKKDYLRYLELYQHEVIWYKERILNCDI